VRDKTSRDTAFEAQAKPKLIHIFSGSANTLFSFGSIVIRHGSAWTFYGSALRLRLQTAVDIISL